MNAAVLHLLGQKPKFESFAERDAHEGEARIRVRAASLKPVDKQMAAGTHYASPQRLPVVCGLDGVGTLDDGTRVYFAGPTSPYGAMAEIAVVHRGRCFEVPASLDDATAAALPNPGVSAWLSLTQRAKLQAGENVLILGATGTTGKLAIQFARQLGAGRIVAAGRNEATLATLPELGADATISLATPENELRKAFAQEVDGAGIQVILDYVWGRTTELLLDALTVSEFAWNRYETRLVQVGESAAPAIRLPAAPLRGRALTITGTAGAFEPKVLFDALQEVLRRGAAGELRIDIDRVPLAHVESVWEMDTRGRRVVLIP